MKPKVLIDRLLSERLALAGIVRVIGVSAGWLQGYVNAKYGQIVQQTGVKIEKKGR